MARRAHLHPQDEFGLFNLEEILGEPVPDILVYCCGPVTAAGVDAADSCTEGMCGTSETSVVDGKVDHRDSLLAPAEEATSTTMVICVSRAAGARRLVLDL